MLCLGGGGYPSTVLAGGGAYPSPVLAWDQWLEVLWDADGITPFPGGEQTDKLKTLPSVILRMRAVTSWPHKNIRGKEGNVVVNIYPTHRKRLLLLVKTQEKEGSGEEGTVE